MNYIIFTGLVQALLAASLLLQGRFRYNGDSVLATLMLCIAVHMAIKLSIYTVVSDAAVRHQMNTFIGFCYGPMLLLYRDQLHGAGTGLKRWYLFLPFILALVGYLTVITVLTVSTEIGHVVLQRYNMLTWLLIPATNAYCGIIAMRGSGVHDGRDGQLLRRLSRLLLAGCILPTVMSLLQSWIPANLENMLRSVAYLLMTGMPLAIIWDRARQQQHVPNLHPITDALPDLHNAASFAVRDTIDNVVQHPTVKSTTVRDLTTSNFAEQAELLKKVESHLYDPAVLSDPELSLDRLAAGVGATRHQLSEMLNDFAGERFFDFISARRVKRTMQKMQELTNLGLPVNVLILAFDAGFKAKSSFNAAFKKFAGMTPTDYLTTLREASDTVTAPAEADTGTP